MMESPERTRVWFTVTICLLFLIVGYGATRWFLSGEDLRPAAPDALPLPTIAPVISPTIDDATDIARYTGDKPLPADPGPTVYLTDASTQGHVRGSLEAPLSILAYTNFSDSYGRVMHGILRELFNNNAERVNWHFLHYPQTNNALDLAAAQGVECMAEQLGEDAAWQYIDALYGQEKVTEALVYSVAAALGSDETAFRSCIEEKRTLDFVMEQKFNAQADTKIFIVPSLVILNNETRSMRIVEGLNTLEYLQAVLDDVSQ